MTWADALVDELVLQLPEIRKTSDDTQEHFENHILTCLACQPGLRVAEYCARGQMLDALRVLAFDIAIAPMRLG